MSLPGSDCPYYLGQNALTWVRMFMTPRSECPIVIQGIRLLCQDILSIASSKHTPNVTWVRMSMLPKSECSCYLGQNVHVTWFKRSMLPGYPTLPGLNCHFTTKLPKLHKCINVFMVLPLNYYVI